MRWGVRNSEDSEIRVRISDGQRKGSWERGRASINLCAGKCRGDEG